MTIYKACAKIDYNGMEGYYTKLKDAVEAVNKFLREEYHKCILTKFSVCSNI